MMMRRIVTVVGQNMFWNVVLGAATLLWVTGCALPSPSCSSIFNPCCGFVFVEASLTLSFCSDFIPLHAAARSSDVLHLTMIRRYAGVTFLTAHDTA